MPGAYLTIDCEFLSSVRCLSLSCQAFRFWAYLLTECMRANTGTMRLADSADTAGVLRILGCLPEPYTDGQLLRELAGPVPHLLSIDEGTGNFTLHGFDARYGPLIERREMNRERTRRWRERLRPDGNGDASQRHTTSQAVTPRHATSRYAYVDVDVDVDAHCGEQTPVLPRNVSVGKVPATASKPGFGHMCPETKTESGPLESKPDRLDHRIDPPKTAERPASAIQPCDSGNGQSRPVAPPATLTPETAAILDGWASGEKYARLAALRSLAVHFDSRDPITLLAHVREVDIADGAACRCAMLWRRLEPLPNGAVRPVPSDAAMAWAKARLAGEAPRPDPGPVRHPKRRPDPKPLADVLPAVIAAASVGAAAAAPTSSPEPSGVIAAAFAGLTCGWDVPGSTNHEVAKATARMALASDPERVLALALELDAAPVSAAFRADPWTTLAERCRDLRAPAGAFLAAARAKLAALGRAPPAERPRKERRADRGTGGRWQEGTADG